tara:strand:+ start:128 stop:229 length:102 start_codon:yes stop_codon:yes gene_type:complete
MILSVYEAWFLSLAPAAVARAAGLNILLSDATL